MQLLQFCCIQRPARCFTVPTHNSRQTRRSLSISKWLHRYQTAVASLDLFCNVQCLEEAGTNQVLIFVHSRKETYKTAKFLQEEAMRNDDLAKFVPSSSASREVLQVLQLAASVCGCLLLLPLSAAAFCCC